MPTPSLAELQETLAGLEALDFRKTYQQFYDFAPYAKQRAFLTAGATFSERLLIAGNQNGKTHIGAFEVACHMTGIYPDWWKGRRWDRPTRGWICGETSLVVRDVQQKKLCGEPGVTDAFGTGMIPKNLFADKPSLARGITDAYDTIQVKHASGGISVARFKSYEQGREKFQGETLDWLWFDEEPPEDIYTEGLTRTAATRGMCFTTFTPLKGPTKVVDRFLTQESPYRCTVNMKLSEAEHIPEEEKKRLMSSWPVHERDARANGVPMLGSGAIFTTPEEAIIEDAMSPVPLHFVKLWGVDFGVDHPFAAVLMLWDKDADVIHIHHTVRMKDALVLQHVKAMSAIGIDVPVAWPHDGHVRDRTSGEPMAKLYKREGSKMLPDHATFETGGYSTEAGILEIDNREKTGRLKVARHLTDWLEERRFYHRKDGQIVKLKDDLMSATRMAVMAKRFARPVPLGSMRAGKSEPTDRGGGGDFNLFTGD